MKKLLSILVFLLTIASSSAQFAVHITGDTLVCKGSMAYIKTSIDTQLLVGPLVYELTTSTNQSTWTGTYFNEFFFYVDTTVTAYVKVTDSSSQISVIDSITIRPSLVELDILTGDSLGIDCGVTSYISIHIVGADSGTILHGKYFEGAPYNVTAQYPINFADTYLIYATNALGCLSNFDSIVTTYNNGVSNFANFIMPVQYGCVGKSSTFINTSDRIIGWNSAWVFGDGTGSVSTNPTANYISPGKYIVQLVIDSANCSFKSDTQYYRVQYDSICYSTCYSKFTVAPDSIQGIYIASVNTYNNTGSFLWDFGDGTTSTQLYTTHIYNTPGFYNICLTANDGNGCVYTYCDSTFYVFKDGQPMSQIITRGSLVDIYEPLPNTVVLIYPNPATESININLANANAYTSVQLLDYTGRVVAEQSINGSLVSIARAQHSAGMYFVLLVKNDNTMAIKKVIFE